MRLSATHFFLITLLALTPACRKDKVDDTAPGQTDTGPEDSGTEDSGTEDSGTEDSGTPPVDADGDGHVAAEDCNDADASIFPGAQEVCDGQDNDCDGRVDDDDPT